MKFTAKRTEEHEQFKAEEEIHGRRKGDHTLVTEKGGTSIGTQLDLLGVIVMGDEKDLNSNSSGVEVKTPVALHHFL